MTVAGFLH